MWRGSFSRGAEELLHGAQTVSLEILNKILTTSFCSPGKTENWRTKPKCWQCHRCRLVTVHTLTVAAIPHIETGCDLCLLQKQDSYVQCKRFNCRLWVYRQNHRKPCTIRSLVFIQSGHCLTVKQNFRLNIQFMFELWMNVVLFLFWNQSTNCTLM